MTRVNKNLKLLILLGLAIFVLMILGTTKVEAASGTENTGKVTSGTLTSTCLDSLPSAYSVDLKESEFEKASNEILKQVISELQKQNITISIITLEEWNNLPNNISKIYIGRKGIYDYYIEVVGEKNYSKQIKVSYSNSSNYNDKDKQYIENYMKTLNLPKRDESDNDFPTYSVTKYYELTNGKTIDEYVFDFDYKGTLQSAISDTSIIIKNQISDGGTGRGPAPFDGSWDEICSVFKNDVYYTDVRLYMTGMWQITIPYNISSSEYDNYITQKVKDYIANTWNKLEPQEVITFVKLEKENDNEYKIYYTVDGDSNQYEISDSIRIVRGKEDTNTNTENPSTNKTSITNTDTTTKVKLEADTSVVPANTKLEVKNILSGTTYNLVERTLKDTVSKMYVYDITLKSNNATIQPNGNVKISIPIPTGIDTSKLVVYRIAEDGTKTEYKTTIKDNYATIETDHFSTYVLAEKSSTQTTATDDKETDKTPSTDTSKPHIKDDTPKTGEVNLGLIAGSILSTISLAGIIITKKF